MKRLSSFVVCFLLLSALFAGIDMHFEMAQPAGGTVIYVGGTGGGNYSTIHEGIDAANPGDTVYVYNGTYYERLTIDKTISLVGEDSNTTWVINDMFTPLRTVVISADWVNFTGLNITNGDPGIWITGNHTHLWKNQVYNNSYGIETDWVYNLTINDNIFSASGFSGVELTGAGHNVFGNLFKDCGWGLGSHCTNIINNTFRNNYYNINIRGGGWNNVTGNNISGGNEGISVYHFAERNSIKNNVISDVTYGFFSTEYTYDNDIIGNTISNCAYAMYLGYEVGRDRIENNCIQFNDYGVYLEYIFVEENFGDVVNVSDNVISNNNYGIYLNVSSGHNITENDIVNNTNGVYLEGSSGNHIFHNNIIENTIQAHDDPGDSNQWDDGYPSGGNFWSDYNGSDFYSGPNQDIVGSDGIGDTPYFFNFSQDNYPLMDPMGNFTFLRHGWNPISVPRIQPSTKMEDVLSQVNGSFLAVQWFNASDKEDPWKHYNPSKPSPMNDLDTIDHTMGLQIHVDDPGGAILDITGTIPTQNQTIPLFKGWNMVGFPSLTNKYRPDALNNLAFGTEVDSIWTYNSGAQKWEEVGELNYFVVGKGYWIHATQDCVWEVPL